MCFNTNKRRFEYQKDAFSKNKSRRLIDLAHAAAQLTGAEATSSRSPLISRTLNADTNADSKDKSYVSDRENSSNEKLYSAQDSGDEGSVINLISSSPSRGNPNESAPIAEDIISSIPADVPECFPCDAGFVIPPNFEGEGAPLADFDEFQVIARMPGSFEDLFGDSVHTNIQDIPTTQAHFIPADSPIRMDGTYDGHQLDLLDLSALTQESNDGSDEDSSQSAQSTLYGRKRPRRHFDGKFWETHNFLCHEYDQPTREKPFPILSRYYVNPIRISGRLSTRSAASTKAVVFADSGWRTFIGRYGHLDPLQNEERRVFDHLIYTLSHYPAAICHGDVRKKEDVLRFLKIACNYFECLSKEERKIRRRAQRILLIDILKFSDLANFRVARGSYSDAACLSTITSTSSSSSSQKNFYCPRCNKRFSNSSSVTRHVKQPQSACAQLEPASHSDLVQVYVAPAGNDSEDIEINHEDRIIVGHSDSGDLGAENSPARSDNSDDEHDNDFLADGLEGDLGLVRELIKEVFAGAGARYGRGSTFMELFDGDEFSMERFLNLYYPFASRGDWEMGEWILRSGLSMALIDELMSLEIIRKASLSFKSAKELRGRAELLPSGPKWIRKPMAVAHPTKVPVSLYYRDAVECLQLLMQNPLYADVMEYQPYRLYRDAEKTLRVFTEWLSGGVAWQMQEKLPLGATLLGTILSSDKTNISIMTGNHTAYPLLISLANIKKAYRLKNSHDTFILLALLPVPKFIHRNRAVRGLLHNQLVHECLDIILHPLKVAALQGIMLSDPLGFQRLCFPVLASYTVDTPEAQLLACVGGKSSPVTLAHNKEFGNSTRCSTRTSSTTLMQLQRLKADIASTDDYEGILQEARKLHLNGVLDPFWRNWFMADPSIFLTPEPLHHFHKEFWDHDARWCINIVGSALIDFLFCLLQPRVGYRQFKEGISSLKQVTGRDHREIQRYIIPIIALIAPSQVVLSIRSLMDVRYLAQSPVQDAESCRRINGALDVFHRHKNAILSAGGRLGKGRIPINHFSITKLELYHNVVPSIIASGSIEQWTADVTEHAHHTDIKTPARSGNNHNYDTQILRTLDRADKCRRFDLATSIRDAGVSLRSWVVGDEDEEDDLDDNLLDDATSLASRIAPVSKKVFGTQRMLVNYFAAAEKLVQGTHHYQSPPPKPYRTFCSNSTAFQLTREPTFKSISIDSASVEFSVPDFRQALSDFVLHLHNNGDVPCRVGGRRGASLSALSFDLVQIWNRVRIQCRAFHYPHDILPAETLNSSPPSPTWPHGLYDTVLVNTDGRYHWPRSQMKGHSVVQLRLIFRVIPPKGSIFVSGLDGFLAYVQRFDIIAGANPDPVSGMFAVRRSLRADGSRQGSIIQLKHIQRSLMLVPRFRRDIDSRLRRENCYEYFSEFWVNDYFDKDTYYSFRLSRDQV